jgi:tetratricopeptide (TPR) repeat protein
VAERRANADELEAVARRVNDPMMHAWATFHRFRADMELGAFEEARADVEQLAHLGEDLGQPTLRWCAAWVRAAYLAAVGRLEDAERYSDLAAEIGRASGQPDTPIFVAAQRFGVCLERGRLAEIQEAVVSAFELNPTYRPVCAVAALVDAELGRIDEAHDRFENLAARDFSDIPVDAVWFFTTSMLALVATRLDDHRRSRTLYDLLYPYAHLIAGSPSVWVGCVSQYLAMLATTLGRFADAEAHFAAAEATHLRVGAPGWLARTRLEWARMLLTRRQPGDLDRARELLGQALATARQLGLAKVEHDGVALLQGCP